MHKTVNSEDIVQAIKANPLSSARRVSGELDISQSSVVRHLHDLGKTSGAYELYLTLLKYYKTFDSPKDDQNRLYPFILILVWYFYLILQAVIQQHFISFKNAASNLFIFKWFPLVFFPAIFLFCSRWKQTTRTLPNILCKKKKKYIGVISKDLITV